MARQITIFEQCVADQSVEMPLAEWIAILQDLDASGSNASIQIYQSGDHWDGYSTCDIEIRRDATPDEIAAMDRDDAARHAAWEAEKVAKERAQYEALKAKFGDA